jgi:hypothetical protein
VVLAGLVLGGLIVGAPGPASAAESAPRQLMNRQSKECLDVTGAAGWNGAEVRIWRCVGAGNQRWQLTDGGFAPQLRVAHSGKCLTIQGPSVAGANIVQDLCENRPEQRWFMMPSFDGYSLLMNPASGLCLDKAGGDVTVWDCWSPWWQHWQWLG